MKHFQLKSRASMRASISHVRARDARAFQTRARETREHFRHARARRARLSLLARLARACLKCSRARAAHPAAGEAPYMNPYVLNQAKFSFFSFHFFLRLMSTLLTPSATNSVTSRRLGLSATLLLVGILANQIFNCLCTSWTVKVLAIQLSESLRVDLLSDQSSSCSFVI